MNYCVLALLTYSNASLALPKALAHPDIDFLIIILLIVVPLCLAAFGSGYMVAGFFRATRNDRVSLMFGLGMKNTGAALVLAAITLGDHPQIMLPILFYNLVQHLVAASVDRIMLQEAENKKATRIVA